MGRAIERLALKAGHEMVLRANSQTPRSAIAESLLQADVAIEFSRPELAFEHVRMCLEAGVPVVCGTTGWQAQLEEARQRCIERQGAFFYASNFSVGVYVFTAANRVLARMMNVLPMYDVTMEEVHHMHKRDAPSGTAISIAEAILQELERKQQWALGDGHDHSTLPITARREGEVPGIHEVRYVSDMDLIILRHEALSRQGFAGGALQAAQWLIGKRGCFGMEDMLGGEQKEK